MSISAALLFNTIGSLENEMLPGLTFLLNDSRAFNLSVTGDGTCYQGSYVNRVKFNKRGSCTMNFAFNISGEYGDVGDALTCCGVNIKKNGNPYKSYTYDVSGGPGTTMGFYGEVSAMPGDIFSFNAFLGYTTSGLYSSSLSLDELSFFGDRANDGFVEIV